MFKIVQFQDNLESGDNQSQIQIFQCQMALWPGFTVIYSTLEAVARLGFLGNIRTRIKIWKAEVPGHVYLKTVMLYHLALWFLQVQEMKIF